MLIGFTDSYSIGAQSGYFSNISYEDGFFGQDEWRLNQRLTLQLGLRYDIITRPYEVQNRQASFDIYTTSPTYGQVPDAGQARALPAAAQGGAAHAGLQLAQRGGQGQRVPGEPCGAGVRRR